ncbi:amidase [Paraferrimonas sp. SM1919]|uniref:amidase n=1 Tax=Paraferrimonas sp. SM1919 TaxID=2662263 RepID=UPI0013D0B4E2|nr:amidase [Paraferrimonas sp. SM1919]
MQNIIAKDLTELLSLVESKQLTTSQVNHAFRERITAVNPSVNAVLSQVEDEQHIGIGIKDNINVAGAVTTVGMAGYRDNLVSDDAFVIKQLKAKGIGVNAKLNMHEGALGASNHNVHYGHCHNPWQLGFTPGGSSGGSAAAVAAQMAPAALGSDTMGSVRIPASYCGLFGYKPSRGLISNGGSVPCLPELDSIGPITKSARDLTLLASSMWGFDKNQGDSVNLPLRPNLYRGAKLVVPSNLEQLVDDKTIIEDFNANIKVFKELGCDLIYKDFSGVNFGANRRAGLILCEFNMLLTHQALWQNNKASFSDDLRALLEFGETKNGVSAVKAMRQLEQVNVHVNQWLEGADMLLLPTTPQRAFSLDGEVPAGQADLTSMANICGLPAVSMPMITEHLPVGMQLIGRIGSDRQLLTLTEQWQQQSGFTFKPPTL